MHGLELVASIALVVNDFEWVVSMMVVEYTFEVVSDLESVVDDLELVEGDD